MIGRLLRLLKGNEAYWRSRGARIGRDCRILDANFGSEPFLVEIGDRVTISFDVALVTHDGATWLVRDEKGRRYRYRPIRIGSDVFVGARAIIMPGVEVGDRCIIGAGSIVTRSVPSGAVAVGNPARIIGLYEDFHARALAGVSEADMRAVDAANPAAKGMQAFRNRVMHALDPRPRPPLPWPADLAPGGDAPGGEQAP